MALNISTVGDIFQDSFDEWIDNAEPDDDYTRETVFKYMYWVNYDASRDKAKYTEAEAYLILVEPPKKWRIFDTNATVEQCEIPNELSIYVLRRGVKVSNTSDKTLTQYFELCRKVLLEYLDAVKHWRKDNIRLRFPADLDLVFDVTPNLEVGVHANINVTYY